MCLRSTARRLHKIFVDIRVPDAVRRHQRVYARLRRTMVPLRSAGTYRWGPAIQRKACALRRVRGTQNWTGMTMRFAAIADIHGNYLALEAVLADIRAAGITDIVNLGDMASGPLDARRTMDMLMALHATHVLGNHDRWLIDRPVEKMGSWERPAYAQLDAGHLNWLRTVPPTCVFRDQVFLCHATPADDNVYWLETVTPDGSVTMSPPEALEKEAEGISQSLILCAHTHIARAVRLGDGRLVVNPGSV